MRKVNTSRLFDPVGNTHKETKEILGQ